MTVTITVHTATGEASVSMDSDKLAAATIERLATAPGVKTITVTRPVAADLPDGWEWVESDTPRLGTLTYHDRIVNYDVPADFAAQFAERYMGQVA